MYNNATSNWWWTNWRINCCAYEEDSTDLDWREEKALSIHHNHRGAGQRQQQQHTGQRNSSKPLSEAKRDSHVECAEVPWEHTLSRLFQGRDDTEDSDSCTNTSSVCIPFVPHHQPWDCGIAPLPPPPPPPQELPLRFLRAAKGDPVKGMRRYEATLAWRKESNVDTILRDANDKFDLIKQHYPHYCHGRGKNGEPCYYEMPTKTDLKALRAGGVTLDLLLRHYIMVTEFQWQYLERGDMQRSIYIIDLNGMRFGDFVGDVVDFVKRASALSSQHYPERAGYVFVINVPSWFKMIWSVIKPMVDEATLEKIYILRGTKEISQKMEERIPLEHIPADYGGKGVPLGKSIEEGLLRELVEHNNDLATRGRTCNGTHGNPPCKWCTWTPARSY